MGLLASFSYLLFYFYRKSQIGPAARPQSFMFAVYVLFSQDVCICETVFSTQSLWKTIQEVTDEMAAWPPRTLGENWRHYRHEGGMTYWCRFWNQHKLTILPFQTVCSRQNAAGKYFWKIPLVVEACLDYFSKEPRSVFGLKGGVNLRVASLDQG